MKKEKGSIKKHSSYDYCNYVEHSDSERDTGRRDLFGNVASHGG